MLPRVPEGRHNVAHGACPERRDGEAAGNKADKDKKAPAGAALRAHAPNVAQNLSACRTIGGPLEITRLHETRLAAYFAGVVSFFSMSRKLS
jgi:hypothetical protein